DAGPWAAAAGAPAVDGSRRLRGPRSGGVRSRDARLLRHAGHAPAARPCRLGQRRAVAREVVGGGGGGVGPVHRRGGGERGPPPVRSSRVIVALAGGVGAARLLRGLVRVVAPADVTAVVNTGDDVVLHGLHVSPDL